MLIKKIKAHNFKTYLHLDLDISVDEERPIILIGGANGGGKTTLFEAIYGALYGLQIQNADHFKQLLNAGAYGKEEEKITLELHFSGKVLNETQQYVLTRTYIVNPAGMPVESVRLNMNGTIFLYGTATAPSQKAEQEAQVNKIIKANLPQELSRYFLFDAMEAGNLLKADQLNRVIKENIENVMGFNKYMQMAQTSELLHQAWTAQRLQVENEKKEYLELLDRKKTLENKAKQLEEIKNKALQYSVNHKDLYEKLKSGLNQDKTIKNKIEQTSLQIQNIEKKETLYREEVDAFVKEMELNICMPKLLESVKTEIQLILANRAEKEQKENSDLKPAQIEAISKTILQYLITHELILKDITLQELTDHVISVLQTTSDNDPYHFLEFSEVKALEKLINMPMHNPFPALHQQQNELDILINQIPALNDQMQKMRAQIAGQDYSLLKAYEENEDKIKSTEKEMLELKTEIDKANRRLHQYDIQSAEEPDPKYETLGRLKPFFEEVANGLLKNKKQQIELKMKHDLNLNLAAYRDVIERVELSENLKDLSFKIFHKAGNEIYLNQLNTASKQVVVQVLLKALHEYGDYEPPVMIDTVMGVLDEASRATLLENYFPELSHQTILLSSDSEIRKGNDLEKIVPFISKAYTLLRDVELQKTEISEGYFGVNLND
ncbi:MAG: AAA family ATPase [Bacteroidota bacterium]